MGKSIIGRCLGSIFGDRSKKSKNEVKETVYAKSAPAIDPALCIACGDCVDVCPGGAIKDSVNGLYISGNQCIGCMACFGVCPMEAIS